MAKGLGTGGFTIGRGAGILGPSLNGNYQVAQLLIQPSPAGALIILSSIGVKLLIESNRKT